MGDNKDKAITPPVSPTSTKSNDSEVFRSRKPRTISGSSNDSSGSAGSPSGSPTARSKSERIREARRMSPNRQISHLSRLDSVASSRSRLGSVGSAHRRSSLSLPHADSIPFHLEKPSQEEIDLKQAADGKETSPIPWWTSKRVQLSFVCFLGFFCLYAQRVNLSIAIVCMVRSAEHAASNGLNETLFENGTVYGNVTYGVSTYSSTPAPGVKNGDNCPSTALSPGGSKKEAEFVWDKKLQGFILGAFFWGYTVMQIPGGYLSDVFGARLVISCGMIPVGILTILCPLFARGSPYLLLVARVLIGIGEAVMYSGAQTLWAKWSPPHERSRLVGFAFGGCQLGNALTFPIAGFLCAYGFDGGWPSVFYIIGGLGFVWSLFFVFFARNTPGEMPRILPIEKKYIEQSLGMHEMTEEERKKKRHAAKPWLKIFTSLPVWAILVTNACGNYGAYMLLTQMPTYMKEVLKFDIQSNGVFSMIPYLVFWVMVIVAGQFADLLISREILSIVWTRKLCACIGTIIPGIFLVITGYMDCNNQMAAIILLTLSMGFCGFQFASFFINHGDIAPKYAGTVFGFTNMGASFPGIIAPYVVSAVTPNKTQGEWLLAFYIAGGVYVVGAIFYMIFAQGEVQEWAREDEEELGTPLHELKGIVEEEREQDQDHDDERKPLSANSKTNGV